jgi:hypothetical protein
MGAWSTVEPSHGPSYGPASTGGMATTPDALDALGEALGTGEALDASDAVGAVDAVPVGWLRCPHPTPAVPSASGASDASDASNVGNDETSGRAMER